MNRSGTGMHIAMLRGKANDGTKIKIYAENNVFALITRQLL